jgi:hypothetical protein
MVQRALSIGHDTRSGGHAVASKLPARRLLHAFGLATAQASVTSCSSSKSRRCKHSCWCVYTPYASTAHLYEHHSICTVLQEGNSTRHCSTSCSC